MRSYLKLLQSVYFNGEKRPDRTGIGTHSIFGERWFHDMREGFPLLTTKHVSPRWVFEELRWFLSGSTDETKLRANGPDIWKEWATEEECAKFGRTTGDLGPIYGHAWRNFGGTKGQGVDQVAKMLDRIKGDPHSRRNIVSGWHAAEVEEVSLPPCHTLWQVYCHVDNRLSLHLYMRSCDVFLGLPYNIASYAMLLMMLSKVTRKTPGNLIISFGDIHLYGNHVRQTLLQTGREPHKLPNLLLTSKLTGDPLKDLLAIRWSDFKLEHYIHHPKIEAPIAV